MELNDNDNDPQRDPEDNDDDEEPLPVINENASAHHTQQVQHRTSYRSVGSADSAASSKDNNRGTVSLDKRLSFITNTNTNQRRGSGQSSADMSSDDSVVVKDSMRIQQRQGSDGSVDNGMRYLEGRRSYSKRLVSHQNSDVSSAESGRSSTRSSPSVKPKAQKFLSYKAFKRTSDQGEAYQNQHHINSDAKIARGSSMWADAALVAKQDEEENHGRMSTKVHRRYKVGDDVLISNVPDSSSYLLNKYGFPSGKGFTLDEQRGPYNFLLAYITAVHYGENKPFYTTRRFDTGEEIRSDSEFMEIIKPKALEIAKKFSSCLLQSELNKGENTEFGGRRSLIDRWYERYIWSVRNFFYAVVPTFFENLRDQFRDLLVPCLNGEGPFQLNISLSAINVLVCCHLWYLFIDQLRLAFIPASMDYGVSVVSLIVWLALLLELIFEYFSRPFDFFDLLSSRNSFAPSTRRFIGRFNLVLEAVALIAFVPEVLCVLSTEYGCDESVPYSILWAIREISFNNAVSGVFLMAALRLRMLGILRHVCNRYLRRDIQKDDSFNMDADDDRIEKERRVSASRNRSAVLSRRLSKDEDPIEDVELVHATYIGTGMMVANSTLLFILIMIIVIIMPLLSVLLYRNVRITVPSQSSNLLQEYLQFDNCAVQFFLMNTWLASLGRVGASETVTKVSKMDIYVIWAQTADSLLCPNSTEYITVDFCNTILNGNVVTNNSTSSDFNATAADINRRCEIWRNPDNRYPEVSTKNIGIRLGEVLKEARDDVVVQYNIQADVENAAIRVFTQQVILVIFLLSMVAVLREDINRLVIRPVQYMLKIVSRYKNNPMKEKKHRNNTNDELVGNYETEQLIIAFTKITSLLRKCWGEAGANIITSNLKGTSEKDIIINPLIPGKCVHALFGFAAMKNFDHSLRSLESQIMILINIIANVLHGEVHKWGFGDSGQCNKNLGGLFLMVFKIGEDGAVQERLREAASVVFKTNESKKHKKGISSGSNTSTRSSVHSIQDQTKVTRSDLPLASLPGIDTFADRALIGMLKTFAGIHRDKSIERFVSENKLLLGYGTEDFEPDMIFGMDAGWAVEGAVGSEYKIDATYLSPHVNMASRMMSACKQYGVTILLSEAVENILSKHAKARLRHLDTVTVKGSINVQRIYTYDARYKGVDFFLSNQSGSASNTNDMQSMAELWSDDLDLQHMRRHVTKSFLKKFNEGRDAYLAGQWEVSVPLLEEANLDMVQNAVDSGYHDHYLLDELANALDRNTPDEQLDVALTQLKDELGDGPCQTLIQYMVKRNCIAPADWKGWKALMSK